MSSSSKNKLLKKLFIGQSLMVQTEKEVLVGKLYKVDINMDFIILDSVKDVKNNYNFTSRQLIPYQSIMCIEPTKTAPEKNTSNETFETASCESFKSFETTTSETRSRSVTLSPFDKQLLQKQLESVIVLRNIGIEYNEAIADIKTQQVVAFSSYPIHGPSKTSFVTIATVKTLYIFDILSFKNLTTEIKSLLESERPRKAILTIDDFQHQPYTDINGVFDIHASYCDVTNKNVCPDLKIMVKEYFDNSDDLLKSQDYLNSYDYFHRPLQKELIVECGKRVFYTLKLQEHLEIEKLSSFYKHCANFSRMYADDQDLAETALTMIKHAHIGIENYIYGLNLHD